MAYIGNPILSTDYPVNTFSGNGSTTAFTLSLAPASVNSILVAVSGVIQDPSTYTVSGTTLTFTAAPPSGTSNISVRHLGIAGIPNTPSAGSVITASIADANITQAKLASGVAGNGPAFSAYKSTNQTATSGVMTKVTYDTEVFDTASCFNTSNSRFTPNVAGYYQVNITIAVQSSTTLTIIAGNLYKNGVLYRYGVLGIGLNGNTRANLSDLVYMNGTTDYLEVYARGDSGTIEFVGSSDVSSFSAVLVRAA